MIFPGLALEDSNLIANLNESQGRESRACH